VLISLRVSRRPPDEDHAYGHGKVEFVAVAALSTILAGAVIFILVYSVVDLLRGIEEPPHLIALPVAAVTMATNEFLARRGFCAARHVGSPVIETAADHNHADAISSLAALVGISGALLGIGWLDPTVAVFETVHIVYLSGGLLGYALRGLMDAALPPGELEAIGRACVGVAGVQRLVRLRTRKAGSVAWVDAVLLVAPTLRVNETTALRAEVERRVRLALSHPAKIQVRFVSSAPEAAEGIAPPCSALAAPAIDGAKHG